MTRPPDLLKAVRSGKLTEVVGALNAGARVELDDGRGDPGLPLAIACFMGYPDIVRELVRRGAKLNFADNREAASPLSMAIRGGKKEVIATLIELGVTLPPGVATGLSEHELMLARWRAEQHAAGKLLSSKTHVEEIQVISCYGTDTGVLDAEMRRAVEETRKP